MTARLLIRADSKPPLADLPELWAYREVLYALVWREIKIRYAQTVAGVGWAVLQPVLTTVVLTVLASRWMGIRSQSVGFHPELTGRENVYFDGAVLGMSRARIRRQFDEIVAFSEAERFIDTPVKLYSSGMKMRLAFSVAAHLEPDILLIDEALSVGDAAFREKSRRKIAEFASHGRTLLLVSHEPAVVAALCSRAIVLRGGVVADDGNAADTLARYGSGLNQ